MSLFWFIIGLSAGRSEAALSDKDGPNPVSALWDLCEWVDAKKYRVWLVHTLFATFILYQAVGLYNSHQEYLVKRAAIETEFTAWKAEIEARNK